MTDSIVLTEGENTTFPRSQFSPEVLWELQDRYGIRCSVQPRIAAPDDVVLVPESNVGVIELPGGTRVELRPKTPLINIFRMWELATGTEVRFNWAGTTEVASFDELYSRLAEAFVRRVQRLVTLGLYRSYRVRSDERRAIRGRIDVRRHLTRSWSPAIPCRFEEHETDNEHNRLLVWALFVIARSAGIRATSQRLATGAARPMMQSIALHPHTPSEYSTQSYNRLNSHYKPLHAMARFFVDHAGPMISGPVRTRGVPFLVNTPRLFERFVAEWLRANIPDSYEVTLQPGRVLGASGYRIVPDIVLYDIRTERRPVAILDTKYKTPDRASDADIYQVATYALEYGVPEGWLIYPTALSTPVSVPIGKRVWVRSACFRLDYDLDDAGFELLAQLGLAERNMTGREGGQ